MTIQPYDIGTFLVASSPTDTPYLVDLWFRDEPWSKPKPVCGCYQIQCKGEKTCKHLEFLVNYLKTQTTT